MDEKDQLKKCEKKGKKVICDNLNDKKRAFEKRGQRKKKEKYDNLDNDEKEQLRK